MLVVVKSVGRHSNGFVRVEVKPETGGEVDSPWPEWAFDLAKLAFQLGRRMLLGLKDPSKGPTGDNLENVRITDVRA
jgi:hypothetical protein